VRPPTIPGMPGMVGSHENWGNFKCHKWGEYGRHSQIVVLIAMIAATGATGWLMTTDAFCGSETTQAVHSVLADGVLALVGVHLGGVALASLRHRENLVRAMVVGVKRPAKPGDVA
jgi:hypothetical protein